MKACLALAAFLLPTPAALAADLVTGPDGALWCERIGDLARYVEALAARDAPALEALQDCANLKPGVRVEILEDLGDQGAGPHLLRVRVFGNGASVDGYTSSGWIGGAVSRRGAKPGLSPMDWLDLSYGATPCRASSST